MSAVEAVRVLRQRRRVTAAVACQRRGVASRVVPVAVAEVAHLGSGVAAADAVEDEDLRARAFEHGSAGNRVR